MRPRRTRDVRPMKYTAPPGSAASGWLSILVRNFDSAITQSLVQHFRDYQSDEPQEQEYSEEPELASTTPAMLEYVSENDQTDHEDDRPQKSHLDN